MSWLFSRALVAAFSAGTCSAGAPSAPLSLMPTPQPFLHNGKTTAFSKPSQYGLTFEPLTVDRGEALLMWYRAGFPVRTSAAPDAVPVSTELAPGCGWKWLESYAKYDPAERSWKTRQFSLLGGSESFSETWPKWGWMRSGECSLQPTWEPRTSESASGFWPTPAANEYEAAPEVTLQRRQKLKAKGINGNGFGLTLGQAAHLWGTPTSRDHFPPHSEQYVAEKRAQGHGMRNLNDEIARWGTPTARDHKDSGDCSNVPANGLLGRMVKSWSGMTDQPGSLCPEFHLWLMGWPGGWNALEPLAMDKYRSWLQQHGAC